LATVREIDARIVDGEISFFYTAANYEVDVRQFAGGLDELLLEVLSGSLPMPDIQNLKPRPPISPLALQSKKLAYVILKLAASKNWQFSHDHPPFSIGLEDDGGKFNFEARRVDPLGKAERIQNKLPAKDGCMVAYFISDGASARTAKDPYAHSLNVHVDLMFGAMQKARLPLIIDPDVRYPGGSGIDPYP